MAGLAFLLLVIFLAAAFFLTGMTSSFRRLRRVRSIRFLQESKKGFFYRTFMSFFFKEREFELLLLSTICAKNISRFCYAVCSVAFLRAAGLLAVVFSERDLGTTNWLYSLLSFALLILGSILVGEVLPRFWSNRNPEACLRVSSTFASPFLVLFFPLYGIFLTMGNIMARNHVLDSMVSQRDRGSEKFIEIIQEVHSTSELDEEEKKLITSAITFKDRIVREIMTPRVDVLALDAGMPLEEAWRTLGDSGFSRAPVFDGGIDQIVGILLFKDIPYQFLDSKDGEKQELLVREVMKPVLYTPETKKISHLLQDFRKKQTHMAVVVDEFGGTSGIVTFEDVLEEIVGEIEDEFDTKEEELCIQQPDGSWVVDARMNLLDIEEEIQLSIPKEGDYDTIGGYVFHKAGVIPSRGLVIHHDDFELEIISSNARCIEKVLISPTYPHSPEAAEA